MTQIKPMTMPSIMRFMELTLLAFFFPDRRLLGIILTCLFVHREINGPYIKVIGRRQETADQDLGVFHGIVQYAVLDGTCLRLLLELGQGIAPS